MKNKTFLILGLLILSMCCIFSLFFVGYNIYIDLNKSIDFEIIEDGGDVLETKYKFESLKYEDESGLHKSLKLIDKDTDQSFELNWADEYFYYKTDSKDYLFTAFEITDEIGGYFYSIYRIDDSGITQVKGTDFGLGIDTIHSCMHPEFLEEERRFIFTTGDSCDYINTPIVNRFVMDKLETEIVLD
ncbi:MAG TPA: hypothetical protein VGA67_02390 [Candidatus Dojkabacteria bacterium]|jgi:hypothetical protein